MPWTSRTRLSDSIGVSVPSTGSGFSTLPPKTVARSVPVLGLASLTSAVSNRPLMTVSQTPWDGWVLQRSSSLEVSAQLRLPLARGQYLGGLRRLLRRVLMTGVQDQYQGVLRREGCRVRAQGVRDQYQGVRRGVCHAQGVLHFWYQVALHQEQVLWRVLRMLFGTGLFYTKTRFCGGFWESFQSQLVSTWLLSVIARAAHTPPRGRMLCRLTLPAVEVLLLVSASEQSC